MNNITATSFLTKLKQNYKSILWATIILILSLFKVNTSDSLKEHLIPHIDKLAHIFLYMVFSFLLLFENKKSNQIFIRLLFALIYGVLMEIFQKILTSYRSMEVFDIIANLTGIIIGYLLYLSLINKL